MDERYTYVRLPYAVSADGDLYMLMTYADHVEILPVRPEEDDTGRATEADPLYLAVERRSVITGRDLKGAQRAAAGRGDAVGQGQATGQLRLLRLRGGWMSRTR